MFLSIIIPVYNLENYIAECLDSCLNQNFEDYEIICVNDGSKDNSAQILDYYAQKHPEKIRVIHKENGGVSSARNTGIENAKGKWIWFIDGDDTIALNSINKLANGIKTGGEILTFNCIKTYTPIIQELNEGIQFNNISTQDSFACIENNNIVCCHWLSRDIICNNNLIFDTQMKYLEDNNYMLRYKSLIKSVTVTNAVAYFYYQRGCSSMHNIDHSNHMLCMKKLINTCHDAFLMLDYPEAKRCYARSRTIYVKMFMWDMLWYNKDYREIKKEINILQTKGIYPYKETSRKIQGRNNKERIASLLYLMFRFKTIYFLLCKAANIVKTIRRKAR